MEYHRKPSKQVDEEVKRRLRSEGDCSMVTMLQPNQMLKSEVVLHEASRKNSVDKVRELIAGGVNVNSRNNLDRTPLQWAAANGHVEVVELLLAAGADIECQDKYGMSAILWAAWFGHKDAMQVLVQNGANINCVNRHGLNILHCASQNNHVDIIKFIVDLENFKIATVEKEERTPLHLAAEKGHLEAVNELMQLNVTGLVPAKDKKGQTAVHVAAAHGHVIVLEKLLLRGVEIDDRDSEGRTAVHMAAEAGHKEALELLFHYHADVNAETTREFTPLMLAGMNGHQETVALLIKQGAKEDAQNNQGNTALHLASLGNQPDVVRQLVDAYANLNPVNKRQQTPLHAAVETGLSDVVEVLLIAGADLELTEKTGKTALNLASRGSFIGIVDMLIKADRFEMDRKDSDRGSESSAPQCGERISQVSRDSIQFRKVVHSSSDFMKAILFKLATKQFKQNDWKNLAVHWGFTNAHIKAIEHQYTGPNSYKEHGYRLLLIWLHGIKAEDNPLKHLFEGLVAIERRELAEHIRKRANLQVEKAINSRNSCILS